MTTPDLDSVHSAHLVGIGGAAMTPLATILLQSGVRVSGSDLADAPHLRTIRALGGTIAIGHRKENVGVVDVVVASSAVPDENPELLEAQANGIPVVKHSQALASLMHRRRPIAVAGTHGKSTTTALIAYLLDCAGRDPTFHVGAELINYDLFGRLGKGDVLVAEADEFDRRFLDYDPEIIVITGVEPDHLDYYGDFERLAEAFQEFANRLRPNGAAVVCADNGAAAALKFSGQRCTYGASDGVDWQIARWEPRGIEGSRMVLRSPRGASETYDLRLLGKHNALNAAAAVAVADRLAIPGGAVRESLATFLGVHRRLERTGCVGDITVIDDYGHHPTEVRASLGAVRAHWTAGSRTGSALWVLYQPHTEHRTASLLDEFAGCFDLADHVFVTPAYMPSGRVLSSEGATAHDLIAAMSHPDARALPQVQAADVLAREAQPGDVIVVMGAGDIWMVVQPLLDALEARFANLRRRELSND